MLLVAWITFVSVFSAYQQTTEAAEYIAGAVAAIGGGPLLTALLIGGVVVAGGVALYEFSQTDAEDYRNFYTGIKNGFMEFVSDQEKQIALEQNQSLTDQEAADLGVAAARDHVNNFFDNAIDTTVTTGKNLTARATEYWKLYSGIINGVADNGIEENTGITPTTVIEPKVQNFTGAAIEDFNISPVNNVGANCREIAGNWYIYKGNWVSGQVTFDNNNIFPFVEIRVRLDEQNNITGSNAYLMYYQNGEIYQYAVQNSFGTTKEIIQSNIERYGINFNTFIIKMNDSTNLMNFHRDMIQHYGILLAVAGAAASVPIWKRTIKNTLDNTHFGQSITKGRRALTSGGDVIEGVFTQDSIPVKKSGTTVAEGVVSSPVGYDIPAGSVWDDVFSGGKPYADVVGGTGSIAVPDDVITGTRDRDTIIDYPDDASVQDSTDYPETGTDDPTHDIPSKPVQDVFENQGGTYYPSAMDLTNIFPFCIPFDVIYIIEKFNQGQEEAPVLTIPIVYPNAIQSAMGSTGYEVVIDFEDFIILRNILRVFILLLFIAGLMKITRDLIRG